jgi:3-hydroxy-9,10-secoandrosta-1,3,5(10)-triene-9,17-dione monooxygenase
VRATERALEAAGLLMDNAGGSAMRVGDGLLQRAWRDIHTARGHVTNDPERALLLFGRNELGLEISDLML